MNSRIILVLGQLAIVCYAKSVPDNVQSDIETLAKNMCPALNHSWLVQTNWSFLQECPTLAEARALKGSGMSALTQALCVLYYNSFEALCISTMNINETTVQKMLPTKDIFSRNLTISNVCKVLAYSPNRSDSSNSYNLLKQALNDQESCVHTCEDLDKSILPACRLSAIMVNTINTNFKAIGLEHGHASKPKMTNDENPVVDNAKPVEHAKPLEKVKLTENVSTVNKTSETATAKQTAAVVQTKLTMPATAPQEPQTPKPEDPVKHQPNVKPASAQLEASETQAPKPAQGDVKQTQLDQQTEKIPSQSDKGKTASEEVKAVKPLSTVAPSNIGSTGQVADTSPSSTVVKPEHAVSTEKDSVDAAKTDDDKIFIEKALPNKSEDYNREEEDEEEYPTEELGKEKDPMTSVKPKQTDGDASAFGNLYSGQDIANDDSYFFQYFMMICVLFVVCYVAYHNKQKILALVLEGRKGRRQQRRRPNSANYHKLDSNLEEAVTSSINKNATNVIY